MSRVAVFLDRDGTLNELQDGPKGRIHPPASPGELRLVPAAAEACRRLADAGLALVVVTNQPDVARGTQQPQVVDQINATLGRQLPIDAFYVCFHDDVDGCSCRKPAAGLLRRAASELDLSLSQSFMVGDRENDVLAGAECGCTTILVGSSETGSAADHVVADVGVAADLVLDLLARRLLR